MRTFGIKIVTLGIAATLVSITARSEVKEVIINSRTLWLHGRRMGAAGPYEKLQGRIVYQVDPRLPANQAIADIALAPRNAAGLVEFSGDFVVLRPADPARARPSVVLEILNRGRTQANEAFFSTPPRENFNPESLDDVKLEDTMAFDLGFTMAWVGWQFDLPKGPLRLEVPAAQVNSIVRDAAILSAEEASTHTDPLNRPGSYCASDTRQPNATLTVKQRFDEPGQILPRSTWSFAREDKDTGKAIPDPCAILVPEGFKAGQLYEAVYTGAHPPVAGLGLAAIRDFVSYIKYGGPPSALRERPWPRSGRPRVLGYGYSQSGRFLRQYLYDGFTADEQGRKTFDGLFIASAGAGRGSFNHRYAMPGEAGTSVLSDLRPTDLFPFADGDETDPIAFQHGSLLAKPIASKTLPKIFYTYSSSEYWARFGSLATTTVDGRSDLPLDPNARLYFFAGTPHSHSAFPPVKVNRRSKTAYADDLNFSSANWSFRALLLDLDAWCIDQPATEPGGAVEPPASAYPSIAAHTLVELAQLKPPTVPQFEYPKFMPRDWRMNFGPDFATKGVIAYEPPRLGAAYTVLVPQVDADGNDLGGIASPFLAVPLGTFTGWNYELPRLPAFDYLAGLSGGFAPFARTRSQRQTFGDTRPSLEERYKDRADYLAQAHTVILKLVAQRFLRAEDIFPIETEMAQYWDGLASANEALPTP